MSRDNQAGRFGSDPSCRVASRAEARQPNIGWLMPFVKPQRRKFLLAAIGALGASITGLFVPYLVGALIDAAGRGQSDATVAGIFLVLGAFLVVQALFIWSHLALF